MVRVGIASSGVSRRARRQRERSPRRSDNGQSGACSRITGLRPRSQRCLERTRGRQQVLDLDCTSGRQPASPRVVCESSIIRYSEGAPERRPLPEECPEPHTKAGCRSDCTKARDAPATQRADKLKQTASTRSTTCRNTRPRARETRKPVVDVERPDLAVFEESSRNRQCLTRGVRTAVPVQRLSSWSAIFSPPTKVRLRCCRACPEGKPARAMPSACKQKQASAEHRLPDAPIGFK